MNEFDAKKASSGLGSDSRPLNRENVEKFLSDFGLEPEFSLHSNIRGLSGGGGGSGRRGGGWAGSKVRRCQHDG